ncbi:AI-2E family transporter [Aureliella helgolandensis]|uniref:AI-2E family transporter n=1 Tax=Aureliella helgolandensis TaxID=2527968 RepID=UPI001E5EB3A6|nr:AI-2E family transporter [Aureliella helgolandensis]
MDDSRKLANKVVLICGIALGVVAVVGLVVVSRSLLPLIFGAILFAVVLNRLARKLDSWIPASLSRGVRISAVIGFLTLLTVICALTFAHSASEQIVQLTDRVDASISEVVQAAKEQPIIQRFSGDNPKLKSWLPSSAQSLGVAKNFFATAFGVLADCLILLILACYFCFSPQKYRGGALRLVPIQWRERLDALLDESSETLWRWMVGRLLAMLIVGVLFGAGLALLGIPLPIELGIFAGLVTFVPNIGGIAAVIPALLLASQQDTTTVFSVLVLYLVIQFVESYLVTPLVQEHQVSLPPALVILAQIVAGMVFGFWGIMFATPLVAIAHLWIKQLYVEEWLETRP